MPTKAPPPVFSWSGCYVGGHVGWGWSRSTVSGFQNFGTTTSTLFGVGANSIGIKTSGALFGGQLGCDYQFAGNFVVGVVGSASAADINGTADQPLGTFGTEKTDGLFDISGRLGYAFGPALLYVKGGAAWAHDQVSLLNLSTAVTLSGGLAGGGIEWSFTPNWSGFVEYNHYFLNNGTFSFTGVFANVRLPANQETLSQSIDAVKVGVNYRFR